MHKKKVLILTPFLFPNKGGVETFCGELIKEARKKHDVGVVTINRRKPVIWKGLPFLQAIWIAIVLYLKGMSRYGRFEYDTIHAQGFIAGFVGVFLPGRLLITTHALYDFKDKPKWFRKLCRWVLNKADKVFTEGELCEKELRKIKVKKSKIIQYQHWVDLDRFYPPNKRNKIVTVLFVGRPIYEKGMHIIKAVENDFKREETKVRFIYATDIEAEKMPAYYRRADILVVPSIYSESFARVVLEGCASGCTILASNYGSLPDLVHITVGRTFNPTVENFKNEIRFLCCQPDMLRFQQGGAREFAENNFSNKNAETMIGEY